MLWILFNYFFLKFNLQKNVIKSNFKICEYLEKGGEETIDKEDVGAYMVKGNQWYSYDNEETIRIKVIFISLAFNDFSSLFGALKFWII